MPLLERPLDALVQLLVASRCFNRPEIASADDCCVLCVEVEGEVDLVEGAQIEVLRCHRVSYVVTLALSHRALTFIALDVDSLGLSAYYRIYRV